MPPAAPLPLEVEPSGYEPFRRLVLSDPALQDQLIDLADHETFVRRNLELGHEHGFQFQRADVESVLQASRRAWIERWIV